MELSRPAWYHLRTLQALLSRPYFTEPLYQTLQPVLFRPCFHYLLQVAPAVAREFYGVPLCVAAQGDSDAGAAELQQHLSTTDESLRQVPALPSTLT